MKSTTPAPRNISPLFPPLKTALQTLHYFLALGSAIHLWLNSGRKRRGGWLWFSREIGGGDRELEGVGGGPAIKGRGVGRAGNDSARGRSKEKREGLGSGAAAAVEAGKGGLPLPKPAGGGREVAAKRGGDGHGAAAAGGGNGEHIVRRKLSFFFRHKMGGKRFMSVHMVMAISARFFRVLFVPTL